MLKKHCRVEVHGIFLTRENYKSSQPARPLLSTLSTKVMVLLMFGGCVFVFFVASVAGNIVEEN